MDSDEDQQALAWQQIIKNRAFYNVRVQRGESWVDAACRTLDELIDNNIKFDVRTKGVFDDIIYTAYILINAESVCYTAYPIYYYRQVEGSITNSFKENALEINKAIFESLEEFFEQYNKFDEFREAYYACVIRRMVETIKVYFINSKNKKNEKILKNEYLSMILNEPYKTALKNVNLKKLNKKQKAVALLSKKSLIWLLWIIFKNK